MSENLQKTDMKISDDVASSLVSSLSEKTEEEIVAPSHEPPQAQTPNFITRKSISEEVDKSKVYFQFKPKVKKQIKGTSLDGGTTYVNSGINGGVMVTPSKTGFGSASKRESSLERSKWENRSKITKPVTPLAQKRSILLSAERKEQQGFEESPFESYRGVSADPKQRNETFMYLANESEKYKQRIEKEGTNTKQDDVGQLDRSTLASTQRSIALSPKTPDNTSSLEYQSYIASRQRLQMSEENKRASISYEVRPNKQTNPDELGGFSKSTKAANNRNDPSAVDNIGGNEKMAKLAGRERSSMSNENRRASTSYEKRTQKKEINKASDGVSTSVATTKPDELGGFSRSTKSSNNRSNPDREETEEFKNKMKSKERSAMSNELTKANQEYEKRSGANNLATKHDKLGKYSHETKSSKIRKSTNKKTIENTPQAELVNSKKGKERKEMSKELGKANKRFTSRDKVTKLSEESKSYEKLTKSTESRQDHGKHEEQMPIKEKIIKRNVKERKQLSKENKKHSEHYKKREEKRNSMIQSF